MDGPSSPSWEVRNILPPPGFDPETIQPVQSPYIHCETNKKLGEGKGKEDKLSQNIAWLRPGRPRNRGLIPSWSKRLLSRPQHSDRLWRPPGVIFNRTGRVLSNIKEAVHVPWDSTPSFGATFENEWSYICTSWSTRDILLLHLSD